MRKLIILIFALLLITGCASKTPRYQLADEFSGLNESNAALLQIPNGINFLSFDENKAGFSLRDEFMSQAVVQHKFRETLVPPGVHYVLYTLELYTELKGDTMYWYTQEGVFATAVNFQKGHTYRLQGNRIKENGEILNYGWIEGIPVLLQRKKIKPGFDFEKQFDYWRNQDWKVVGVGLDSEKLREVKKEDRSLELLLLLSEMGIDGLKAKFPNLK